MHGSHFFDAGNQLQHYPQNSPSFFADLCICYFWTLRIFWKRQNCWCQFSHSFNKCFLHHHNIYATYLTANMSTREVCQSTGEIPDSTAQPLPIPSREILSSPVAAINYASWTESLLGVLPAETWQKLVVSPLDTINSRLRGNNVSVGWGMLSSNTHSFLPREVSATSH